MRNIMTADQIIEVIDTMQNNDFDWVENNRERNVLGNEILSSVDLLRMMGMLKAIYLHRDTESQNGRKIKISDENILKKAEKLLFDEFSLVFDLTPEDIRPIILGEKIPKKKNLIPPDPPLR